MIRKTIHKISAVRRIFTADLDYLVRTAERFMDSNKLKKAVFCWRVILKRFPKRAPDGVYIRLARCYIGLNQLDEAKDTLNRLENRKATGTPRHLLEMKLEILVFEEDWEGVVSLCSKIKKYPNPQDIPGAINQADYLKSICERIINISDYKQVVSKYRKENSEIPKGKKIAIYTAVSGGYDFIKPPKVLNPKFDYIVFADNPIPDTGIYSIRPLPYIDNDPTRSARYVKTHPHTLLSEYETAVWIDANLMIEEDISPRIQKFIESGKSIGAIPHPDRKNIYEEAEACIERAKDDSNLIENQIKLYKEQGIVGDQMIESNFMTFNLSNEDTSKLLNLWWREIDSHSRRDQLSLPFAIESLGISWYKLMKRPNSTRTSSNFTLTPHSIDPAATNHLNNLMSGGKTLSPNTFDSRPRRVSEFNGSVDVVVCIHNALEDVKKCLNSIELTRPEKNFRLILIDDGSDNETKQYLLSFSKQRSWVHLSRRESASGYSRAANRGLRLSSADLVFLLNSDTIVTKGWIDKMADTMYSRSNIGIVGPLSTAASHQSIPDHLSTKNQTAVNDLPPNLSVEDMNEFCEQVAGSDIQPLVPLAHGFCQAIKRDVIDTIGYFDEESFPRGYGEENDYCFRATNAGFSLAISTNTFIYHAKSKSYIGPERVTLMKNGSEKLKEIHGEERIRRSILSMQANPLLVKMRLEARKLYESNSAQ